MSFGKRCFYMFFGIFLLSTACPCAGSSASPPSDQIRLMYTIQVGSVKKLEDAQRELNRIKAHDQNAFIRHETVRDKGMWYRIYAGLFSDRASAKKAAEGLKKQKIIAGFWVKKIAPPFPVFPGSPPTPVEIKKVEKAGPVKREEHEMKPAPPTPAPARAEAPQAGPRPSPPSPKSALAKEKSSRPVEIAPTPAARGDLHPQTPSKPKEISTPEGKNKKGMIQFSIGLKAGANLANSKEQVETTTISDGKTRTYLFSQQYMHSGLVLSCLFKDRFFLNGSVERSFVTKMEIYQFTLDTGIVFHQLGPIKPYAGLGLIYSHLDWSEFPGTFDDTLGWKIEGGGLYQIKKIQIGVEASYQAIDYRFNLPTGTNVTNGTDSVNLSGFAASVFMRFQF